MFLKQRVDDHGQAFIKFGFAFLAIANIGNYLLHRNNAFPNTVSDPVAGFLFGLSFGCFGLGIWALRRRRSS